ncbi:PREDICTED: uncharacterized protein LOC107069592 [Polistes dominula]|uniref:Uncharacterized protein LOC107069592 n=1 Tax=Polistes dominula TaxID=743375 RepID=A0ABM1IQN6_POLDO|nr:PREDICTED: uncharacterized protein LOC107069592 [Polistes dominula]XP_015182523.1 PREDICTED: uncharacterized protein LOC107069592 [Polistes dominula]XP_015182524.1 PREDICTED: uncharacterized protein LOC107069592 [Polistes dominula]
MALAKLNYIDRNIEKVKTNWEQFQKHDRRKEKYIFNPHMKKLYKVLESTVCDKNKIKENVDSTNDQDILLKDSKFSKNSKINQCDVEHIKKVFFPKGDQLTVVKSTSTNLPSKEIKEDILGNEKRDIVEQQLLFTEKLLWNINDILTYESNLLNPYKNDSLNNTSRKVKTEIDKYLLKYTANFDKLNTVKQKNLTIKVMESQNGIQENSNKNLSYSFYVNQEDINNFKKNGNETSVNNNEFAENKRSASETPNIDTKSTEIYDEFNEKLSKGNAFVKMSCNNLNLPKNVLNEVLQSEYLKKELLSLYPI